MIKNEGDVHDDSFNIIVRIWVLSYHDKLHVYCSVQKTSSAIVWMRTLLCGDLVISYRSI